VVIWESIKFLPMFLFSAFSVSGLWFFIRSLAIAEDHS
jgi:hypothetical protein